MTMILMMRGLNTLKLIRLHCGGRASEVRMKLKSKVFNYNCIKMVPDHVLLQLHWRIWII